MAPLAELAAVVVVTSVLTCQPNPALSVRVVEERLCGSSALSPWRWWVPTFTPESVPGAEVSGAATTPSPERWAAATGVPLSNNPAAGATARAAATGSATRSERVVVAGQSPRTVARLHSASARSLSALEDRPETKRAWCPRARAESQRALQVVQGSSGEPKSRMGTGSWERRHVARRSDPFTDSNPAPS